MAAILLVPGRSGRYTSEAMSSAGAAGADTIDVSRCTGLSLQVSVSAGVAGNYGIETTVDGVGWALLPAASAIATTDKSVARIEGSSRPLSVIRINPANVTGLDATHTITVTIEGNAIGSGLF